MAFFFLFLFQNYFHSINEYEYVVCGDCVMKILYSFFVTSCQCFTIINFTYPKIISMDTL
jgi:hypothetical protein